LSCHRVLFPAR